jgi:hypothetical protein
LAGGNIIGHLHPPAKTLHRKVFELPGTVLLTQTKIIVTPNKRAPNPLPATAGSMDRPVAVPWLGGKELMVRLS